MSSWQHIVATQIADGVVYPLSRYIDTDLHEVQSLTSMYQVRINISDFYFFLSCIYLPK